MPQDPSTYSTSSAIQPASSSASSGSRSSSIAIHWQWSTFSVPVLQPQQVNRLYHPLYRRYVKPTHRLSSINH